MHRDEIASRLAGLSPAKRALLERRRRGEAPAGKAVSTIGRRAEAGPAPLSFPQQRLWLLDQLQPGTPTYNLRVLLRLIGPLDRGALARSLREVVRRHEILRTVFREEAGGPAQVILPEMDLPLPRIDLTGLPAAARERESLGQAREIAEQGFDLSRPPLLRVALVTLAESEHRLLVVKHHMVSDGWSMGVLVREVGALYEAFLAGAPPPLPELPIQYADFAAWQRERLTGEALEGDLAWWRERLAGVPAGVDLPTDRPRPAVQSTRGAAHRFAFAPTLMESLEALARRESATPFMVLAAGLFALLARLSGQEDLTIGTPVAARNVPEVEGLIGFFVNMLVFRAAVEPAMGFLGLLRQVREVMLGAYGHQDVPFERLVAEVAPDRDTSRNPLFQVALALQNAPVDTTLPGLVLHPEPMPASTSRFDLSFIVGGEGGALAASLEYVTDLFEGTTAARLCEEWLRLLAAGIAEPAAELVRLDLLSAAERHQLLREWNDTRAESAGPALLHEGFEKQADRAPDALAALWQGEELTYRELEERANRLANLLRSLGAGPESPVGIWMERSIDMVAAMLATNKAGAAYLPIDGGWPADRAEAVLAGTGAGIVLTRRTHLPAVQQLQWRLPKLRDAVALDVATPELPPEPIDLAETRAMWDAVAERAFDWVTEAGFWSAYTGEPFPAAEVLEYRDRVISLGEPWIGPDKRVLEIGSGSGLILWELAPRVRRYVGLDPSGRTQERNRARAEREGIGNVELITGFAHEIEELSPGSFDLVILASAAQFFPGLVYLERVLDLALSRLAPGGALVVADVLDPRLREDFRRSLAEYAAAHPGSAAARAAGRPGEGRELYVDESFFADLPAALPAAAEVEVRRRRSGFPNELRFRYDVVVRKGAEVPAALAAGRRAPRSRRAWTAWHAAQSSPLRPRPTASPVDVAYVIHTSGSTGAPKGIVVQHRPAVELNRWINASFGVGPADRILFVTSPAFDLSVYDVFGVLGAGGTVHVASEEDLRDADRLVRLLVEEPITVWDSAPAALQRLAPLFPPPGRAGAEKTALRLVMLSGDWIPVKLPDAVRASFPHARVMALGGATEATVWSNWYPVREVDPDWPSIPYGRPISNARYHVLDKALEPCPVGVPGDLYIAGSVLCVGYARLPEMTAEKFLPDPFSGESGARMYFTGDRARYHGDGLLEFLGRVDQQVKVRGYRIELEEIEAVLVRQPQVREAAVLAREDVPGDKRLVAYVVPSGEPAPTPMELRVALQQVMPEYMVPSAFVVLERMPVTANGKLDRKALPAPLEMAESDSDQAPPETAVEVALAAIWQEVLGRPAVGRNDDFFDLGGSSLLATQVISRARQAFAVELPLLALFETRTLADLAEYVEELRAERGGEAEGAAAAAEEEIVPAPRGGDLPLSFAQQRLWVIDQLDPGSPLYNIPGAVRLRGPLDAELLGRVLREVARRHEVLRTTFRTVDGRPVQAIAPALSLPLEVVDLSGVPTAEREAEVARRAAAEARQPFDLAAGPLFRATLLRLGAEEHVVLATFHHIVSDGWSMGIFFREIAALFRAWSAGEPSPLPELPVQYADFAVWQRRRLSGEALEAELDHWRQRLAGAPRVLELPTDRPRPAVRTSRGRSRAVAFPPALVAPVEAWGQERGATLFMTLLGAFATLLGRYSGQDDVVIGSPIAGRDRREIEGLIGFFVNTLALRVDLHGDPAFGELLGRVRGMAIDAFAHQSVPFERLVDELVPARDPSYTPLFQVAFALQNAPMGRLELPGLTLEPLPVENGTAKFDLTLSLSEAEGGLTGALEHSLDLFDEATMDRLAGHYGTLLAGLAEDPARPLSELPLLTPAEREQVLEGWNDTARPCPQRPLVHERFAGHARLRPEAVAVGTPRGRMTYGELESRSNRLAHHLAALGVGPETLVAVAMDRTLERVVGILGVLKAGGAYVSVDPTYPPERLAWMLADSGAPVLLTDAATAPALPATGARVIRLDADWESIAGAEESAPESGVDPENLAYVIYTSGSTGRPKGVAVPHAGLTNLVRWHQDLYGVTPEDRGTQTASPAFDASVWELWPYLTAGASVHAPDEDARLSSPGLVRWLAAEGITLPFLTTPLAAGVLEEKLPPELRVRALIVGGDRLNRGAGPGAPFRLMNHYGPTEYSVVSTVSEVPPQEADGRPPRIGRPIHNTRIHVLGRYGEVVPTGVAGELHVAGTGLARGYLRRPDLTAEKFVPDPFATTPGGRMYRTGDLVRWLPDGEIDFLGRIDHQVKVRGLRIELGEIEAVLGAHSGLRELAVVAREDRPGDRRLAAYVAPAEGVEISEEELRGFLAPKLPAYMVPAAFVILPALPLTPGGKVDRAALPAPQRAAAADHERVAPRTPAETVLAGIWAQVLGHAEVGVHDNFFELGGDSILGVQVVSRAQNAGLKLTARDLFQHQTVAALAEVAAAAAGEAGSEEGEIPLSPAQRAFLELVDAGLAELRQPASLLALDLREAADPERLERAFQRVAGRHAALRCRFVREADGWHQLCAPAAPASIVLERIDLWGQPWTALAAAAARLREGIDPEQGPLARAALVELEEGGQRLLLAVHPLAADEASRRILTGDLEAAYRRDEELPPAPASFPQWSAKLAEQARSAASGAEVEHWLNVSRTLVRPLPADPAVTSAWTDAVELSAEETRALLQEAVPAYHSRPEDALLAALVAALAGWTGEPRVLVDLEGSGRESPSQGLDLSRTVGALAARYPALLEQDRKAQSPGDHLKAVKEQLRAVPHGGLGYGLLRYLGEEAQAERLRAMPVPEVSFRYRATPDAAEGSLFAPAPSPEPASRRGHRLEVDAEVVDGRLRLTFAAGGGLSPATVQGLADRVLAGLRELIEHVRSEGAGGFTPSDFPEARFSQKDFNSLMSQLGKRKPGAGARSGS